MEENGVTGSINGHPVDGFKLNIEHKPAERWTPSFAPSDFIANRFEVSGTIAVEDPERYQALLGEGNTFTIEQRVDLNPHHRQAEGFRRRAARLRDIIRWHWRKLIRKPLPEVMVVTIPDVPAANLSITAAG